MASNRRRRTFTRSWQLQSYLRACDGTESLYGRRSNYHRVNIRRLQQELDHILAVLEAPSPQDLHNQGQLTSQSDFGG